MEAGVISRMRTCWPALAWLAQLTTVIPAGAAPYVVEGQQLGERVPLGTASYRSYRCKPSGYFEGYTWCERTQPRRAAEGGGSLASAIMHAADGTAVYLMARIAPVSIDRTAAQKEIEELSSKMNERPAKVEWFPGRAGIAPSVIALWGEVELRQLTPDEAETVANDDTDIGVIVDSAGNPTRSAKAGQPVYRMAGGAGYLYSASFEPGGRGHRRYVAVDVSQPAIAKFEPALHEVLREDQSLAADDYGQWQKVAFLTRNLSLAASPTIANRNLDKVFDQYPSKKLRSPVWSLLPLGSLDYLAERAHSSISVYGPNTKYPEIRESIQKFLAEHPAEPFSEFLYYTIGEFDKALRANPNSIIAGVIRYATGFKLLGALVQETAKTVKVSIAQDTDTPINDTFVALNKNPQLYDNKLLASLLPDFATRAAAMRPWFEAVMRDQASPHQDDAAYVLGWLAFHEGKFKEALGYLAKAVTLGNGDYRQPAALRLIVRIMARVPAREQIAIIESDRAFGEQAALWYMAARSAYRDLDYALAVATAERGLKALKVPLDSLPASTDPKKIRDALDKVEPKLDDDLNLYEMPYLVEASREILQYQTYLKSVATERADNVAAKAKAIITKYSLLLDPPQQAARRRSSVELAHKDLRQAVHLVDMTLEAVPKAAPYASLREWAHYRKVRILVRFAPKAVADAVAAMEQEFPKSRLTGDALAEQLYAEGVMLRDVSAAQATFRKLLANFPNHNAIDNAYTWMAIIYRCEGRTEDAQKTNRDIIRLFPMTRHARYARDRAAKPAASACGLPELSQQ
jgi:tetratricopeptide (TPR) repeat protein